MAEWFEYVENDPLLEAYIKNKEYTDKHKDDNKKQKHEPEESGLPY